MVGHLQFIHMFIILFGVTGSGKTTVGSLLAATLDWKFYDADDFHPKANVEKMRQGIPLTDQDRMPWLAMLRERIQTSLNSGEHAVLACSALKESYRQYLYIADEVKFVHLKGTLEDVLQDSFIKIWKNIDTYNHTKGSLFTFILNITRNTAIDKTRSMAYKQEHNGLTFEALMVDKNDSYQPQIDYIGVDKYVTALAPQHQELINYVYFEGYTQDEAARVLAIPLGTAKSRIKVAIGQLRLMLN